jgi:hypothetical protein
LRRRDVALGALLAIALCTAPTVGDVGGCGVEATDLSPATFAAARKAVDCQRCTQCGLTTHTCRAACANNAPSGTPWPQTCHPLQHDGDVCVRALRVASCADYASFVDDADPTLPTECDFCHLVLEAGPVGGEF